MTILEIFAREVKNIIFAWREHACGFNPHEVRLKQISEMKIGGPPSQPDEVAYWGGGQPDGCRDDGGGREWGKTGVGTR